MMFVGSKHNSLGIMFHICIALSWSTQKAPVIRSLFKIIFYPLKLYTKKGNVKLINVDYIINVKLY